MNEVAIMSEEEQTKLTNINNRKMKKVAKAEIKKTDFPKVVSVSNILVDDLLADNSDEMVKHEIEIPVIAPGNEEIGDVNELYGIKVNNKNIITEETNEDIKEEERKHYEVNMVLTVLQAITTIVLFAVLIIALCLGLKLFGVI